MGDLKIASMITVAANFCETSLRNLQDLLDDWPSCAILSGQEEANNRNIIHCSFLFTFSPTHKRTFCCFFTRKWMSSLKMIIFSGLWEAHEAETIIVDDRRTWIHSIVFPTLWSHKCKIRIDKQNLLKRFPLDLRWNFRHIWRFFAMNFAGKKLSRQVLN